MLREFTAHELWFLVLAARWTVVLSAIAFVGGGAGGFIVAILRVSRWGPLAPLAAAFIKIGQGTPLLMQLYLVYFGASLLQVTSDAWTAAALGLTLYASAFLGEIWRGCIHSVPREQWEAARALALGYPTQLRWVVLPQAARIALPPTVGFLVQLLKGTSLASIIGFTELTRAAQIVNNATFRPLLVYASVAAIYFMLCWPLSLLSDYLERRLEQAGARTIAFQI
jgi:polar amino acid transport system permease protein